MSPETFSLSPSRAALSSPSFLGLEAPLDEHLLSSYGKQAAAKLSVAPFGRCCSSRLPRLFPPAGSQGVPTALTASRNPLAVSKIIAPPPSSGSALDWWQCGHAPALLCGSAPRAATGSSSSSLPPLRLLLPLIYWPRGEVLGKVLGTGCATATPASPAKPGPQRTSAGARRGLRPRRPSARGRPRPGLLRLARELSAARCSGTGEASFASSRFCGRSPETGTDRRARRRPWRRSVQVSAGTPARMVLGWWGPEAVRSRKGSGLRGANSLCRTGVCLLSLGEELAGAAAAGRGDCCRGRRQPPERYGRGAAHPGAPSREGRFGRDRRREGAEHRGLGPGAGRVGAERLPRAAERRGTRATDTGNLFKWAERAALPHPRDGAC